MAKETMSERQARERREAAKRSAMPDPVTLDTKLLPCPFCGGPAADGDSSPYCDNDACGASQGIFTLEEWNHRAAVPPLSAPSREAIDKAVQEYGDARAAEAFCHVRADSSSEAEDAKAALLSLYVPPAVPPGSGELIAAASKGPAEAGILDPALDAVELIRGDLAFGHGDVWAVWLPEHPLSAPDHAVKVCITGNGPTSEANARFIAWCLTNKDALASAPLPGTTRAHPDTMRLNWLEQENWDLATLTSRISFGTGGWFYLYPNGCTVSLPHPTLRAAIDAASRAPEAGRPDKETNDGNT